MPTRVVGASDRLDLDPFWKLGSIGEVIVYSSMAVHGAHIGRHKLVVRFPNIQGLLDIPLRGDHQIVIVGEHIPVLQNAPDLNVRQRKHLCAVLQRFGLLQHLVIRLPGEGNHRAIAVDGASVNGPYREAAALVVNKLHVGVFLPRLSQNLHPHIERMHVQLVVGALVPQEINRRRSREQPARRSS